MRLFWKPRRCGHAGILEVLVSSLLMLNDCIGVEDGGSCLEDTLSRLRFQRLNGGAQRKLPALEQMHGSVE